MQRNIVRICAAWQAKGVDTSLLAPELVSMQEVLAELEAVAAAEDFRRLAGELRDHYNAVRAGGAGLETEDDPAKRVQWLDLIEQAADRCSRVAERMGPLSPG